MRFQIVHTTRYQYSAPVTLCQNEAHLRLRPCTEQVCDSSELFIDPLPARLHERLDYFGNPCTYFAIQQSHIELVVTVKSLVSRIPTAAFNAHSPAWDNVPALVLDNAGDDRLDALQLTFDSPFIARSSALADFAAPSFPLGRPLFEAVRDLNARIFREFAYDSGFTTIATPLADVLRLRRGVCQDFAHLAIGCLRSLGLPARYVSGYIETIPPPGKPRLQGADATHAWFAVLDPYNGWVQFDPTNDQVVGETHVVTAWGRDYSDVTPLKGVILGGGGHEMDVSVDMVRISEAN